MIRNFKEILKGTPIEEKNGVFYFHHPPADMAPSRDQNPADKSTWSYWRKQNYLFFEKELSALPKNSVLVDLGAGQSDFAELTSVFNLCAVDLYPYLGVNIVCDFQNGIPLKDASADVVMLSNVLEHVPEPNTLLQECHRILKPGGILLGAVPFMIQIHQRPYDFYRYTHMNLEYMLHEHAFKNASVIPVSNLYALLFNVTTSFFMAVIRKAKYALLYRIVWKIARIKFALFRRFFEKRSSDADSPLGYLFKAYK